MLTPPPFRGDGAYEADSEAEVAISITYGYSRDHRADAEAMDVGLGHGCRLGSAPLLAPPQWQQFGQSEPAGSRRGPPRAVAGLRER
jgi:hypothetical protein